jgi:small subunit ribosomal protein S2
MIDFSDLMDKSPEFDLTALLEAGCHFGHQSKRWHPKMGEWIYMEKNGVHIFDLVKTATQMKLAYNYAYKLGKENKVLVFVATKKQAKEVVRQEAERVGAMYVTSRWLGGILTNWEQVKKSIKRMLDLQEGLKTGKFSKYTKYEQLQMEKEANRLERFFGGIKSLKDMPDALFIVDPNREKVAVKEANLVNLPMMALVDSNCDPRRVDLVIPANDDALKSISTVVKAVADGYEAGKKDR